MSTDPNQQSDKNADEYIRLAYQSALEDIRFFKRQQWIVTNYTVLIYGAIIAVSRVVKSAGNEWFTYITGIIALLSLLLIIQLQCSTQKARNRKGNPGDVDENNHFASLGNCGRRFLCLGKRD